VKHTILIPGTWGGDDPWWTLTGAFCEEAKKHGVPDIGPMFPWSYDVDWVKGKHNDWLAGGRSMAWFLIAKSVGQPINVIAHSHGGQVALYAIAQTAIQVDTLITVGTPIRRDMRKIRARARPYIKRWIHLHSDSILKDYMQILGSFGDGYWGIVRKFKEADTNIEVPGASHKEGLLNPLLWTALHLWEPLGGQRARLPGQI